MARRKRRNRTFWTGWSSRARMHFVLAICCALVLLTVVIALLVVHSLAVPGAQTQGTAAASEPLVEDASYNKDENTIDTAQYASTILEESEDAGQSYVDETLFLGDSNTVRMRQFGYCEESNSLASVGMSARSLATYECVLFEGRSSYVTMPEAVAIMQPQRVILTFGTNDLSPSYSTEKFIENYEEGILAIVEAYPSVDIIVNSIPPLGQQHSNQSLTQTQVDEYNAGLVEMCERNGWKYLNSAEVLKDSNTGYAKNGYVISSDGIHLTEEAVATLFDYIRTHSYITEDDRPSLKSVPAVVDDKDVSESTANALREETSGQSSSATPTQPPVEYTETPEPSTPSPEPTASPTPQPTPTLTPTPTPMPTEEPVPTEAPTPRPAPTEAPTPAPTEIPAPTEPPTPTEPPAASEPEGEAPPADSVAEPSAEAQSELAESA